MSNNDDNAQGELPDAEPPIVETPVTEPVDDGGDGGGVAEENNQLSVPPVETPFDDEAIAVIRSASIYVSLASMFAHSIILVSYFLLKRFKPGIMNRTSLRIVIFNSVLSISNNILHIFSVRVTTNGAYCAFYGFTLNILALSENFLCLCIAVNLNRLFIFRVEPKKAHEYFYYVASISLAVMISTVGIIAGKFGLSDSGKECRFVKEGEIKSYIWSWFLYYLWITVSTVYCFYVAVHVGVLLLKERKLLQEGEAIEVKGVAEVKTKREIYRLASRVVIYPCISALTNFPMFLEQSVVVASKAPNLVISVLSEISIPSQGILYLLAFALDPSVQRAFLSVREDRAAAAAEAKKEVRVEEGHQQQQQQQQEEGQPQEQEAEEELTEQEKQALAWGNTAMEFF